MFNQILAYVGIGAGATQPVPARMFSIFPCIMLLVVICFWGLVIFGLVKLIKYLSTAGKEQKLIRMELGKLADEVQQIRQELKTGTEQKPSANSEGDQ